MSVSQRVHRILRRIDAFHSTDAPPPWLPTLAEGDRCFGVYHGRDMDIAITNAAMWLSTPAGIHRLDYTRIQHATINAPTDAELKTDRAYLQIVMIDGECHRLAGFVWHGQFCDHFEFLRFVMGSVDDVRLGR